MEDHHDSVIITGFSQFEVGSAAQRQGKSRSKACLHCRRRKMKCDGVKPACFQCLRAERGDECEYDDGVTKTNTQLLYERLAQLEKRFRDLQAARGDGGRMRRSPQSGRGISRPPLARSNSMPGSRRGGPIIYSGRSGELHHGYLGGSPEITYANLELSRSSSRSSSRSPSEWSFDGSGPVPTLHVQQSPLPQVYYADQASVYSSSRESLSYNLFPEISNIPRTILIQNPDHKEMENKPFLSEASRFARDLPLETIEHLTNVLVPHSLQVGLTLLPSFINDIALLNPPSDAIGYAMLLWGAHFSKDPAMHELKPMLLRRALEALPQLLSSPESDNDIPYDHCLALGSCASKMGNAISASIILAIYFLAHGRLIEGAYHATTASQLSLACGLHQLPDPRTLPDITPESGAAGVPGHVPLGFMGATESSATGLLPPLRTRIDALTRQHKFWNVFVLQRAWGAAGGLSAPSSHWGTAPGAQSHERHPRTAITTPWPEDWGLLLIDDPQNSKTTSPLSLEASAVPVEEFLAGHDVTPSKSVLHVRAKAAALYEAAADLGARYNPYDTGIFDDERFTSLQFTIGAFTSSLIPTPLHDFRAPSFTKSSLYCTHSMAHAATILLHYRLADVAYAEGAIDNPSFALNTVQKDGECERSVLMDGLFGYERAYSHATPVNTPGHEQGGPNSSANHVGYAIAAADKCVQSAREIVRIVSCIGIHDYEFLEPVVGSCWVSAADVLTRELKRLAEPVAPSHENRLSSEIDIIISGLKQLGAVFPIALAQAKTVISTKNKITKRSHETTPA